MNYIEDLNKRGATITAMIIELENGKFQVISYNDKGIVNFLSEEVNNIILYERKKGAMVSPVAEIRQKMK